MKTVRRARVLPVLPLLIAVAVVLLEPALCAACPVCFSMRESTRKAFYHTAVLLSLLPLGMIGGAIYWLWRQVRAAAPPSP